MFNDIILYTYHSLVFMSHTCVTTAIMRPTLFSTVAKGPVSGSGPNCSPIVISSSSPF